LYRPKGSKTRLHDRQRASFEEAVLPHLDAVYNLARWLTRNESDADDVVQEALLRAFRFFDNVRGRNCRAWLLTIVRNTCYTWLHANRAGKPTVPFDEEKHSTETGSTSPDAALVANVDRDLLRQAIEELPTEFREVLVLREFEGMAYKEIAGIAGIPVGTVMSRLGRARGRLQECLAARIGKES
jgi:RNA polymerase sigma-70 factor (ECF subfamily)